MQIKKFFEKFLIFSPFVFLLFIVIYISAANIEISNVPDVNLYTTDGVVNSIVTDSKNDKIYIGGDFSYVGPYAGGAAVINSDKGTLINADLDIVGSVYTAISDGEGGLYIGGDFTSINGYAKAGLAHINSNYTLDTNFSFYVDGIVYALYYVDGELYVGGEFTHINELEVSNLALIDTKENIINTSFVPGINGMVLSLLGAVNSDNLYIGGKFSNINESSRPFIAKMSLKEKVFDSDFNINPDAPVYALTQFEGLVYFGGEFENVNELPMLKLGRFSMDDGKFDESFLKGSYGINIIKDIIVDGQSIYLGGEKSLVRVDMGKMAIDPNFGYDLDSGVNKMLINNGYLYAVGGFSNVGEKEAKSIIKIGLIKGDMEKFSLNPNDSINTIALLDSGDLFLGGDFNRICGENISNLARIDATTGMVDIDFNFSVDGVVNTMVLDNDSLYIGGVFNSPAANLAKINITTNSVDESFVVDLGGTVNALLSNAGNLFIGGEFEGNLLVVSNLTGEKSLPSDAGLDSSVYSMAISEKGLYVGGNFTNNIALIDLDTGSQVVDFKPNINGIVNAISVDDDAVYIGGDFLEVNGSASPYLAKINNQTGESTKDFSIFPNASVKTLMIHRDNLYVGGTFSQIGDKNISRLAKIDISTEEGSVDDAFVVNPDGEVNALSMNDNNLYVGGAFGFVGAYRAPSFASFSWSDKTPPIITILGENPVSIEQNSWYQDTGVTAVDNNNQDITNSIVTSGSVDVTKPGTYTIRYTVADSSGRISTVERTVNVIEVLTRDGGGSALPPQASMSPQSPKPTSVNPKGELGFIINKNEKITYSNVVTLQFFAGSDTKKVAISEDPNFKYASIEEYSDTKQFKLSEKYGEKTIYVKFYTEYGVSSKPISNTIIFSEEIKPVVAKEIKQDIDTIVQSIDKIKTSIEKNSDLVTDATATSTKVNKIITSKQIKEEVDASIKKIEISKNSIEKSISDIDKSISGNGVKTPQVKKIINKIDSDIEQIKKSTAKIKNSTPIEQDLKKDIEENVNSIQKNTKAIETTIDKKPGNYGSPYIIGNKISPINQNEKTNSRALKVVNSLIKGWKGFLNKIFK